MAFPVSPTNGQIATVNGIRYSYNSTQNSWVRLSSGKFTASATGPSNPATGDHWYNTSEDTLYEYVSDGVNRYWIDIQSASVGGNAGSVISDTTVVGTLTMTGNILPSANITYNLGSSTYRFKDLFLSGTTIDLGGATIKTDATSGAIALIPQPTVANPNPTGIVVSPAGTISTVSTTGGNLTANAISNSSNTATTTNTTTFGNITANGNVVTANVYADRFFYSNGTAFSSSSFGNTEVAAYLTSNVSGLVTRTDAITIPIGTTGERPTATANGMMRYNTTLGRVEVYLPSGGWTSIISDRYSVEYIVVAGGGGGGRGRGGGGGGGGYRASITGESSGGGSSAEAAITVTPGTPYPVTVGGGGLGGPSSDTKGSNGNDSAFSTITSLGGGAGGAAYQTLTSNTGGSGGGGAGQVTGGYSNSGGSGTAGQGYAGGNTPSYNDVNGAGGGGAGAVGTYLTGGIGVASSVTGSAVYRAGGGGGGGDNAAGPGGNGGGGAGSTGAATNGTTNTGGGGGGSIYNNTAGTGGSGIVILRYLGAQRGTGGTVSTVGSYTVHTFTGSGTFTA